VNGRIRRLGAALLVCYLALFGWLNRVMVLDAAQLNARPDNRRAVERDFNRPRGDVVSADGVLLAHSEEVEGRFRYQRTYPTGDLFAHVVGSYAFSFGADGVERTYGDDLAGRSADFQLRGFADPFSEEADVGTVALTLRADVQRVARDALGAREGSVVALDPRTGGILAMWSFPSYDPNPTSANDTLVAGAFREALDANPDKPRLARTYRERFFPGSTFKVVTAAAGLDAGRVDEAAPAYPSARSYTPPLTTKAIANFGGSTCGGTLAAILAVSCNSAFAQMGAETIGPDGMIAEAEDFGFGETPPIDLPQAVSSSFPADFGRRLSDGPEGSAGVFENTPGLAQAAIGQGDVSATPLQMALVAAAVANGGAIMAPHVLDEVRDHRGERVRGHADEVWRTATSPETAATLRRAMVGVVTDGTARAMAVDGWEVGAKTGTAQLGTVPPRSHAWIIAFAGPPGGVPEVAVAVVVEGQEGASEQTGGRVAAPIARAVVEAVRRAG